MSFWWKRIDFPLQLLACWPGWQLKVCLVVLRCHVSLPKTKTRANFGRWRLNLGLTITCSWKMSSCFMVKCYFCQDKTCSFHGHGHCPPVSWIFMVQIQIFTIHIHGSSWIFMVNIPFWSHKTPNPTPGYCALRLPGSLVQGSSDAWGIRWNNSRMIIQILVGGWPTPLKNISQLGIIPNWMEKQCSKPPTRISYTYGINCSYIYIAVI